jgi:hypothetical protein
LTKTLTKEVKEIKTRLESLKAEDDATAKEIHADFFTLIKVTESFNEYLPRINDQKFSFSDRIYNTGHVEKIGKFNLAKENLLSIANQILREIKYGAIKPKLLPPPETISVLWLLRNASFSFWSMVAVVFIFTLGAGALIEKHTGSTEKIISLVQNPTELLKSVLNGSVK